MPVDFAQLHQQLAELLGDHKVPSIDRCDALIYEIVDKGLDMRPVVRRLVEEAEVGRKLREKLAAQEGHTLVPERFIGTVDKPRLYAQVTRGANVVWLPAAPEEVADLRPGDPVLIDSQTDRIVGRDGQLPITGDVVEVESLPANQPGRVYVKREGHSQLARLHHSLIADPDACRPGTRMVYDALRNFVLEPAQTATDGKELLLDLGRMDSVRRQDVGSPKPVVDEILAHLKIFVEHPDWATQLAARMRCSYLFIGGTGTGKSYTLRLIATEYGDFLEAVTGQHVSRVVMCDASQFWRSLFGETEQMIAAWVEKLERLGGNTLRGTTAAKSPRR